MDGKFTFADQRVINLLGYGPQELLGKSCFDYIHSEDQGHMKESFEQVVKMKGQVMNFMYRFRAKSGDWVWLRTNSFAFLNPYTDEIEYVVCTNSTAKSGSSATSVSAAALSTATDSAVSTATSNSASAATAHGHTVTQPPTHPQSHPSVGDYGRQPGSGLDYSMPGSTAGTAAPNRTDMYSSHSTAAAAAAAASAAAAAAGHTPSYSAYDPTPSPGGYTPAGANSMQQHQTAGGRTSVGKTSGGTPTPPGSAWTQPSAAASAGDAYNYNLSPSRSPGSIYRSPSSASTSSSAAAAAQAAAAAAAAAAASSAWSHWQPAAAVAAGNGQATGLEMSQAHPHAPVASHATGHELGDMLGMLGHHHAHHPASSHHPGSAIHPVSNPHHPGGFENLGGMFTGQFQ